MRRKTASGEVSSPEKVVIQFGTRTIKGYLEAPTWDTVEETLRNAPKGGPKTFRIQRLETEEVEDIPAKDAKAVFFVHSFEGDPQHQPLHFHIMAPTIRDLWVRLEFLDGEMIEGIVHNSVHCLIDDGFFLIPTDPGSNNKLLYVVKSALKEYRVLGMRNI
jgi:hypothetical protein